MDVKRTGIVLKPTNSRVMIRPFEIPNENRIEKITARVTALPEAEADRVNYPGTYIAGLYNRLVTEIAGRTVVNEDLVNVPNWLPLSFRVAGGPWFDVSRKPRSIGVLAAPRAHHPELLQLVRGARA